MSVMQKLLEINDELVRTLAEREQLRLDQKTLQEICSMGKQRITDLQDELRKACAERDEAVEHAGRLQTELDATRKQLQDVCSAKPAKSAGHDEVYKAVRKLSRLQIDDELVKAWEERDRLQDELVAARKQLQNVLFEQEDISSAEPAGQSDLVRDVSHYIEAAEVDRPTTIHPPEYTPPEGWRVLAVGEALRDGDVTVRADGYQYPTERVGSVVGANQRYIRPIEPQAEPEPQPVQDGVLVQEGWWLRADGNRVYVRPTNPSPDNIWRINIGFKWSDGARLYMDDGSHNRNQTTPHDLVKFLGNRVKTQPAEPQQSQPEPQFKPYTFAAYIVGDRTQPDALRIVWATEEWIQHAKFGIVHRISDLQFSGNDTFTPDQFSVNLKIQ